MPSLLAQAMTQHAPRMKSSAGVDVTISRGLVKSKPIVAIPGAVIFSDQQTEGEAIIGTKGEAFLIAPADYVLGGQAVEPIEGDQIHTTLSGDTFDVCAGVNGSSWDWSDGYRTFYRISVLRRTGGDNVASF